MTTPQPLATAVADSTIEDGERLAWLQLARTPKVGSKTFFYLLERAGSARQALKLLPELAKRGGGGGASSPPLTPYPFEQAEQELAQLTHAGGRLLIAAEAAYPPLLRAISDAPPVISVLGDPGLLHRRLLAMVGTRHASANGLLLAKQFASQLGKNGLITVSGLARGIDTAVHQASLEQGTIAVLAGGVDQLYPPENRALYHNMIAKGCVVSEIPWGEVAQANHFPRRNRLISGLSLAVLVIEAARRSGSLITARMAADQGREVMAIPGSPLDPRAQGGNDLIRDGALLVQSVDEVLQALPPPLATQPASASGLTKAAPYRQPQAQPAPTLFESSQSLTPDEHQVGQLRHRLLGLFSATPVGLDSIMALVDAPTADILAAVTELELAGMIARSPSDQIIRIAAG
jgi:DNA processing protein